MTATPEFARRYDAIIAGARCAGAATAMLLARGGARVLLVDWDRPGTDTISTHMLTRGGLMQLDDWGLLDKIIAAGTPAIRRASFFYDGAPVHIDVKPGNGLDALYAPRRTLLDRVMAEAAVQAGVELHYGVGLTGVTRDAQGRVTGAILNTGSETTTTVHASIVVGADGRRSSAARHFGAKTQRQSEHATATVYAYANGIDNPDSRLFWAPGRTVGSVPTNDGQHCIYATLPRERFLLETRPDPGASLRSLVRQTAPALAQELDSATIETRPICFVGQRGHLREAAGAGWALVGDAGYFKDPITAHGITDSFRDAAQLARAVLRGSQAALGDYSQTRNSRSAGLFAVTDAIAALDWDMDQLRALHDRLGKIMKQEQEWLKQGFNLPELAA
jgi:flavin-dependent dehydrogenase